MAVLDDLSGFEYENLMGDVFRALGYGNIRQANRTTDEGRDVLMEEVVAETGACDFLVEQSLLVGTIEYFGRVTASNGNTTTKYARLAGCGMAACNYSKTRNGCIDGRSMRISLTLPRACHDSALGHRMDASTVR